MAVGRDRRKPSKRWFPRCLSCTPSSPACRLGPSLDILLPTLTFHPRQPDSLLGRKEKEGRREVHSHRWAPGTKPFTCRLPGRRGASSSKQAQRIRSPHGVSLTHTFRRHLAQPVGDRGPWSRASSPVHARLRGPFPTPSAAPPSPLRAYQVTPMVSGQKGGRKKTAESQGSPAAHTK